MAAIVFEPQQSAFAHLVEDYPLKLEGGPLPASAKDDFPVLSRESHQDGGNQSSDRDFGVIHHTVKTLMTSLRGSNHLGRKENERVNGARSKTPFEAHDRQDRQRGDSARLRLLLTAIEVVEQRVTATECVEQFEIRHQLESETVHVRHERA